MLHYFDTSAFLKLVTRIRITPDICARAPDLDPGIVRSVDALHLATATTLGDELRAVVTYDVRMKQAASAVGLQVVAPGLGDNSGR